MPIELHASHDKYFFGFDVDWVWVTDARGVVGAWVRL